MFDGIEHEVIPTYHGNSKRPNAIGYVQTKASTMDMLGREATINPPKAAYHAVQKKSGGIMGADSISDLPRNRTQAKYL